VPANGGNGGAEALGGRKGTGAKGGGAGALGTGGMGGRSASGGAPGEGGGVGRGGSTGSGGGGPTGGSVGMGGMLATGGRSGSGGMGGTGMTSTGGKGGGGTAGAAGPPGSGGAGGANACDEISARYTKALTAAKECTGSGKNECSTEVEQSLSCPGCKTFVNDAARLTTIANEWTKAECDKVIRICPKVSCLRITGATCSVSGTTGMCVDTREIATTQ